MDRVAELRSELADLASTFSSGRLLSEGLLVVFAGAPNAGKSSLFNLFLREERSIVSPEPGTTRDWIEAGIELEGLRLRLVDTAGLRDAGSGVEAEGVARSGRMIESADLLVYLVDAGGGQGPSAEDEGFLAAKPDAIRVWSRIDLAPRSLSGERAAPPAGFIEVSAATGEGFAELAASLSAKARALVGQGPATDAGGKGRDRVASERQKLLLDRSAAALDAAQKCLSRNEGLDIVAIELREAAEALGELTGEIATPEILETLFSSFCVGK